MWKAARTFLTRDTHGTDDSLSWNKTTCLTLGAVFGPVALVDDGIAFFRTRTSARIGAARGGIEGRATRGVTDERPAADLFFRARDGGCGGGVDLLFGFGADARQVS